MKSALLVIDAQRAAFDRAPYPLESGTVIDRINALSAAARAAGCPVVFVQHERPGTLFAHGSDTWQLAHNLTTGEGDLFVRKTTPDAFLRTDLHSLLEHHGVRQLVVAGYASEFCVDTSTRRAAALGYTVILAADAHTTHDKPHAHASAIRTHANATLPNLTSFGPPITAVPSAAVQFGA